MSESSPNAALRGRFANVLNLTDVPGEAWARETGRFGLVGQEVAVELGSKQLGYCVVSLDPGRASCPYHFHHSEEEVFHVLSGMGVLRQGDADGEEEVPLRAGDFVSFPAGTGIAHQLINRSDKPFVYLAISNRVPADVCEYPDSDKLLVRKTGTLVRRSPTLSYFDGETSDS